MIETAEIGAAGEQAATAWLRCEGYLICERNWRWGRYEIDIIAQRYDVLHFVEVKTRKRGGLTEPEAAFTRAKAAALRKAATAYLALHESPLEPQFDLVAVERVSDGSYEVRMIENVM